MGFITPNTWLNNQSNKKLRHYILTNTSINQIVDYSKMRVFDQATVLPVVTILQKGNSNYTHTEIFEPINNEIILSNKANQEIWLDNNLNIININLNANDLILRKKIEEKTDTLEQLALVKRGIQLYETGKGNPKQKPEDAKNRIYESDYQVDETYIKFLEGKDIHKYYFEWKNRWIKYGDNLAAKRDPQLFEGDRLAVRRIVGATLICCYFDEPIGISQLLHIVKPFESVNTKFILGLLNSNLMAYYFRKKYNRQDKTFPEIRIYELCSLPIKIIDESNEYLKIEITKLVELLIQLKEDWRTERLPTSINQIETKIDFCEKRINELVYSLYNMSNEEITTVESFK